MKYLIPVVIIVLALLGANGIYVVSQGHAVVLTRFGNVEAIGVGPGLHVKLPFVDHISTYDTRSLLLQSQPGDYKTADGEAVRAGFFVRWRVADAKVYFDATHADELQAGRQMTPIVAAALRTQIARHSTAELLATDGGATDAALRAAVAADLRQQLGVAVLAVGIRRIMPPDDNLPAVYKRMTAAAKARADAIRNKGKTAAAAIRAKGDAADAQVLEAADKLAAIDRGQGDVAAAKVYAQASAQDPQFFRYWSTLNTWRKTFGDGGAVVVLDKDSPFMQAVDEGAATSTPGKH
ncbi:MAG TPA: protease modulator HflC [Rhodanobacteraceae bacterium]|nr:protease modulator HflC [Rhodanobacteraceae bacterium]